MTTDGIDLETQIELLVNLGERDPLTIAHKLIERYGEHWAQNEVALRAEEFITDLARRRLGSNRRRAELAIISGNEATAADIKVAKFWIPGSGWKRAAEVTPGDFRARADWYHGFAAAARKRELWCRQVADLMDAEGAQVFGELKAPIPELPDEDDLGQLSA